MPNGQAVPNLDVRGLPPPDPELVEAVVARFGQDYSATEVWEEGGIMMIEATNRATGKSTIFLLSPTTVD